MKFFVIAISILFLISCNDRALLIPEPTHNNALNNEIDWAVHDAVLMSLEDLNTVGISIGIIKNGLQYFYGYGEIETGSNVVPDPYTFFEIGSVSKTFTAIAINYMLDQKGLALDTPVKSFLPEDLPVLQRNGIEITFKNLLNHTSGLPFMPDNIGLSVYAGNIGGAFENYDRSKLYTCLKNMDLEAIPGERFKYSNLGYGILGTILENEYNDSYSNIMKAIILNPLEMNRTSGVFSETLQNEWATPYRNSKKTNYWADFNALAGAGELKSSAAEMMKYINVNLFPKQNALGIAINASHVQSSEKIVNTQHFEFSPALGWFHYIHKDLPETSFLFHNGGTGGFNTDLFINKENNSGLILLYNSTGNTIGRDILVKKLLEIISR